MFKKKNFIMLVEVAGQDADMAEFIEDSMDSLREYVSSVFTMEVQIQTLRFRLEGDEYRQAVMELDTRRRNTHEAAIASVKALNRLCRNNGVAPLYDGDEGDRYAIADFAMAAVKALFDDRTGKKKNLAELSAAAKA